MRANYRVTETECRATISVFDDIDLANATLLADTLFNLIDAHRAVVVDLRGLRYIDSVGLHILLRGGQRAQRVGCEVTLVAGPPVRQMVEQVALDRLIPIVPDVPAARPAPKIATTPSASLSEGPPHITSPSVSSLTAGPQPDHEPVSELDEPDPGNPIEPPRAES